MMSGSKGQNPIVLAQSDFDLGTRKTRASSVITRNASVLGLRELRSNEAIRDISKGQNLLLTLTSMDLFTEKV